MRISRFGAALTLALTLVVSLLPVRGEAPGMEPSGSGDPVQAGIEKCRSFLLSDQNADGSWGSFREPRGAENYGWTNIGTHRAWTAATTGITCVALMDLESDIRPEEEAALRRGLDFLLAESRVKRVSSWDVDNTWGYVYALEAAARGLLRKLPEPLPAATRAGLLALGRDLVALLSRHQTPGGGWGYYDAPPFMRRPSWATSFTTSAAILSLLEARDAGIEVPQKMLDRSVRAVTRCRLPSGAYTYSVEAIPSPGSIVGIDQVKGSLSRIQAGNLALRRAGAGIESADLAHGLDEFFRYHRFLAIGRGRPIPHEAYYAVAGYFFFFGHYHAAGVIESLPVQERERYWTPLREKVLECQEDDGSMWDFHSHRYHRAYGTAWGLSVLVRSLRG